MLAWLMGGYKSFEFEVAFGSFVVRVVMRAEGYPTGRNVD